MRSAIFVLKHLDDIEFEIEKLRSEMESLNDDILKAVSYGSLKTKSDVHSGVEDLAIKRLTIMAKTNEFNKEVTALYRALRILGPPGNNILTLYFREKKEKKEIKKRYGQYVSRIPQYVKKIETMYKKFYILK